MRKISIITLIFSVIASSFAIANEVNVFNARHYKADSELYSKFTNMTGIKVNLINGKSGALEKRIISEGADSSADLYITADAGRCGAMDAKGALQGGLTSAAIKDAVPKSFRTNKWVGIAKRARIIYYSPERVTGAELSGMTYEGLADPKWKGRLVIRKSSNIYNKSLVASLIKNNGKAATAAWAEGVVANMARTPTLVKGAPNKANAVKLVEFLLTPESQEHFTNNTFEFPMIDGVSPSPLVVNNLGLDFKQDMKTKLASYGKNQAAAVEVMTAAGWK